MHKLIKYLLVLPVMLGIYPVKAQYDSSLGNWEVFILKGNLTKKVTFSGDLNLRAKDFHSTYDHAEYKFSLGYVLRNNLTAGVGAGGYSSSSTGSFFSAPPSQKEFRLWFYILFKHSFNRFYFDHWPRFERRYTYDDSKNRFRYRLGLNVPINKNRMINKTVYLSTYNEIFIGQGHPSYEKNKFFAGVGYRMNNNFNFQLGNVNMNDYEGSLIRCKNYLQLIVTWNLQRRVKSEEKIDN